MKYKVGDKVKVRENLVTDKDYGNGWFFIDEMSEYKGKILTIKMMRSDGSYCVDENMWTWTNDMFKGLASEVNKNTKEKNMKDFKIKDYKVYEDTALIVEFEDGTKEKAVCNEDDKFDIERGITICVLKHLFGVDGYKSMVKKAMNQIKAVDKAKEDKKKEEELIARKKAKAARKKVRRLERKRNERIEEMKTAYLAAMKEHDKDDISAALDDILDDLK